MAARSGLCRLPSSIPSGTVRAMSRRAMAMHSNREKISRESDEGSLL